MSALMVFLRGHRRAKVNRELVDRVRSWCPSLDETSGGGSR